MMQKDNVSIKPSYNEGVAVNNGFVVNYEISQKSSDNWNFIDLIEGVTENSALTPGLVHADGAYGNEGNMAYLEEEGVGNYLKYNTYRREKSSKWHQEGVRREDFTYEQDYDRYRCPHGKYLCFIEEKESITASGYKKIVKIYRADKEDCNDCPFKGYCTKSYSRGIEVSTNYERLKKEMKNNLDSEKGKELCQRRGFEVETVFGDKKENNQCRRFLLRRKANVLIESGIYYTSYNLRKLYIKIMKRILESCWKYPLELDYAV